MWGLWKKCVMAVLAVGMLAGVPGVAMLTVRAEETAAQETNADGGSVSATGLICTWDGDTVTISGKAAREAAGELQSGVLANFNGAWGDFWDKLRDAKYIRFEDCKITGSMNSFFSRANAVSIDLSGLDASDVTDMNYMFSICSSLTSVDLRGLDTGRVESMFSMFGGCSSLTNVDLSRLDTGSVKDMRFLFQGCNSLTELDFRGLNVSSVTSMRQMIDKCDNLKSVDMSGLNAGRVTDMSSMFSDCTNLTSVNLSRLDTSSVTRMGGMFSGCSRLTSVSLGGLDTSSVTDMGSMFERCRSLKSIDLRGLDTSSVTSMIQMFAYCGSLESVDMSGLDTGNVAIPDGMFYDCQNLEILKTVRRCGAKSIILPDVFVDPSGRETRYATADFLNTTLTRKKPSEPKPAPGAGDDDQPALPPSPEQFTLTGTITGHSGVAYASISANLVGMDGKVYPATVSGGDALDGSAKKECAYSVSAPAGQYSLEVEAVTTGNVTVNRSAVVKLSASGQTKDVNLPNGQAKSKVQNDVGGSKILVGGLDSLMMDESGALKDGAAQAEVIFTAGSVDTAGSLAQKADAAAIAQAASGKTLEFYDFSIRKTVNGKSEMVTDTGQGVAVEIVIPFNSTGKKDVKVYRFHGGTVDVLTEQEAGGEKIAFENGSLTIRAKKFSVYAIGYSAADSPGGDDAGDHPGNSGSGDGGSSSGDDDSDDVSNVEAQIRNAAKGAVVRLTGVTTLSNGAMKMLLARRDVTLAMEYAYNGRNYFVTIPAGAAVDNDIPWYGPLYLAAVYGSGMSGSIADGFAYTVRRGDTMSGIARSSGMSLAQLAAKNPQIRNIDLILAGQRIHLR